MAGSWSNQAVQTTQVIVDSGTPQSGMFIYNGTPAAGTLVISATAEAGTDPYGNAYQAGVTGYFADGRIAWQATAGNADSPSAVTSYSDDPTPAAASLLNGSLVIAYAGDLENFTSTAELYAESASGTLAINCTDASGNTGSLGVFNMPNGRAAVQPVAETPQTPTLGSGWTTAAASIRNATPLRFWVDSQDNLNIRGSVATTSTTPAGTIFALPTGYEPLSGWNLQQDLTMQQSSAGSYKGAGHLFLSSANVEVNGFTFASGDILTFNSTFPLGNVLGE